MNDPWLSLQHLPDHDISLLSAALLIAKDEYPSLERMTLHSAAQPLAQWTDDELSDAIAALQRWTAAGSPPIGMGTTIEGEATTEVTLLPGEVAAINPAT